MSDKVRIPVKIALFIAVFFIITTVLAFLIRDETSAYTRIWMNELFEQDNVEILYCGASHVSHGITPKVADKIWKKNNFSTGSAGQHIGGTYAVLRQAVKLHKIERVFLELDFAVATYQPVKEKKGFKSEYSIAHYIRDPKIKFDYYRTMSTPKYYINSLLPIGKDKHMSLNPKDLAARYKSFFNGDYFNYVYKDKDADYDGKGCLLDKRPVKNGTFSNYYDEGPIQIGKISDEWKDDIDRIIALCKEHGIELTMYSMPCSDFYLAEKGNYDEYYSFVKKFCNERGFEYYDFNLAKEKYLRLFDEDFHDDNHLSGQGVYKYTKVMCEYFTGNVPKEEMFHDSYAEKIKTQEARIFGLVIKPTENKKAVTITPMVNPAVDMESIRYDVSVFYDGKEEILKTQTTDTFIELPKGKSGKIKVTASLNGVRTNEALQHFVAL
ncbi:hypothetical protein [Treponema berlinense]|uniref:hypothetical protein n=1 Tax=Treponema berlinense TaxID=225004 RepID=UPI0026EAF98C|nr:hypothetical protein [Treponema berlinense]